MKTDERDEIMEKFRSLWYKAVIATNILARGIDIPEVELVINFDVPTIRESNGSYSADYDNYLHRVGRTGRFGAKGIALTLIEKAEDEGFLNDIAMYYKIEIQDLG